MKELISFYGSQKSTQPVLFIIHNIGLSTYELTNHLGNVLSVISDKPIPHQNGQTVDYWQAEVRQATDYSPFGVQLQTRNLFLTVLGNVPYRYGFNGMEKDNELKGEGNSYDFGARMYDDRLGRWLTIDPLAGKYPHLSPYNFVDNCPVKFIDIDGKDIIDFVSIVQKYSGYSYAVLTKTQAFNDVLKQWSNTIGDSKSLGYVTSGKFSEIKLRFEIINTDNGKMGYSDILYDGKSLANYETLPEEILLEKIEIKISLNTYGAKEKKETSEDSFDLERLTTLIHEITVHSENQAKIIEKNTSIDKINGKLLLEDYKKAYTGEGEGVDHENLYNNKAETFEKVCKDVENTIRNNSNYNKLNRVGLNSVNERVYKSRSDFFNKLIESEKKPNPTTK